MPKIFTEAQKAEIRIALLDAGQQALEQKSYKRVAVDELVQAAGIAKGTFYHFFPSKEAFFYALLQRIKQDNRRGLLDLFRSGIPSGEALQACLYNRYTRMKSVYAYFPPEDLETLLAAIPPEQQTADDSLDFAALVGKTIRPLTRLETETIVGMFNILGLAAANCHSLSITGYEPAMAVFCRTMADYILGGAA